MPGRTQIDYPVENSDRPCKTTGAAFEENSRTQGPIRPGSMLVLGSVSAFFGTWMAPRPPEIVHEILYTNREALTHVQLLGQSVPVYQLLRELVDDKLEEHGFRSTSNFRCT